MSTSDRKRESNKRNAQRSPGPKSPAGKARTRFNAVGLGAYAKLRRLSGNDLKEYRQLEVELGEDFIAVGAYEHILFDRMLHHEWARRVCLRAISFVVAKTSQECATQQLPETPNDDEYLAYLKPMVDAAFDRRSALKSVDSKGGDQVPETSREKSSHSRDIDEAVLDGLAERGHGGKLSRLYDECCRHERAFDRNVTIFRDAQEYRAAKDRAAAVCDPDDAGDVQDQPLKKAKHKNKERKTR